MTAELLLLNKIWVLHSQRTNYFYPQQKLMSKTRVGATASKKYDKATAPHRRTHRHDSISEQDRAILAGINPPRCNDRSKPTPANCSPW